MASRARSVPPALVEAVPSVEAEATDAVVAAAASLIFLFTLDNIVERKSISLKVFLGREGLVGERGG